MPKTVYLQLHLLVGLFATTAIFGHLVSLSALHLVSWRAALAAAGAAIVVALVKRRSVFPGLRNARALLGVGAIVGVHWALFFGSIKVSNISICLAGMATASFFTAFTEPLFDRRRVRPLEVLLGLMVLAGIVLVAGFERGNLLGLGLAVCSAFLAAVFPVFNRRIIQTSRLDPLVMVIWEMVGACAVCLAILPLVAGPDSYGKLFEWQGLDWLWITLLAWVCTVFAHAFHIHLLRYLSAYTSNLAINFEPVYGILAAAVLFGEHHQLHPGFYLGTAAIIVANILHPLILRHLARRKAVLL